MHNPDVFDKPFDFIPERYIKDGQIDPNVPDVEAAGFGHGRRYALKSYLFRKTEFRITQNLSWSVFQQRRTVYHGSISSRHLYTHRSEGRGRGTYSIEALFAKSVDHVRCLVLSDRQ